MTCTRATILKCIKKFVEGNRGTATFITTKRIRKHCCDGGNIEDILQALAREGILILFRNGPNKIIYIVNKERL